MDIESQNSEQSLVDETIAVNPKIQTQESLQKISFFRNIIENKNIKFVLTVFGFSLVLVILYLFYFFNQEKNQVKPILDEVVQATTPREKYEQIITGNPIYAQINMSESQVVGNNEKLGVGPQTMISIKNSMSSNDTPENSTKQKTSVTFSGTIISPDSNGSQDFKFNGSLLRLIQDNGSKVLSDFILNGSMDGSIGSVNFNDENQDALHISLTQTDENNSYLKVNMSDYLLIFVNSIVGPQQATSPSISVDTNEIWPFLGQYLHIPKSIESLSYDSSLSVSDQEKLNKIQEELSINFQATLGDVTKYIDINESSDEFGLTTFYGLINKEKLANALADYSVGNWEISNQNMEDLKQLCASIASNEEDADSCINGLSSPEISRDDLASQLLSFLGYFEFEPISAQIDNTSLDIKKMTFGVSLNGDVSQNNLGLYLPFSKMNLHIESGLLELSEDQIKEPKNSVELLSAGNNSESFADQSYNEQTIQGNAYRENKELLLSTYSNINDICGGILGHEYCLSAPETWSHFLNSNGSDNYLNLTLKNTNPADYRTASVSIRQETANSFTYDCDYENKNPYAQKIVNYSDVTTQDGYNLRISEYENTQGYDVVYYDVCEKRGEKYVNRTSYGNISVNPGPFSFQEAVEKISPILASVSFKKKIPL